MIVRLNPAVFAAALGDAGGVELSTVSPVVPVAGGTTRPSRAAETLADVMSRERWQRRQRRQVAGVRRAIARRCTSVPVRVPAPDGPALTRGPLHITTPDLTTAQIAVVREMLGKGFSANKILTLLGGARGTRLRQIGAIREQLELEAAIATAAERARPEIAVTAMEPLVV